MNNTLVDSVIDLLRIVDKNTINIQEGKRNTLKNWNKAISKTKIMDKLIVSKLFNKRKLYPNEKEEVLRYCIMKGWLLEVQPKNKLKTLICTKLGSREAHKWRGIVASDLHIRLIAEWSPFKDE